MFPDDVRKATIDQALKLSNNIGNHYLQVSMKNVTDNKEKSIDDQMKRDRLHFKLKFLRIVRYAELLVLSTVTELHRMAFTLLRTFSENEFMVSFDIKVVVF